MDKNKVIYDNGISKISTETRTVADVGDQVLLPTGDGKEPFIVRRRSLDATEDCWTLVCITPQELHVEMEHSLAR